MTRRILTAREQLEMLSPWRQAARDPNRLMGINISERNQPYAEQILNGEKTIETRNSRSLHPYVGTRVGLIRTHPKQPAMLVGFATIGRPVHYPDAASFDADYPHHLVDTDSPEHLIHSPSGQKYGYPMHDVERLDKPRQVLSTGIVSRGVDEHELEPHTAGRGDDRRREWEEREQREQDAGWSYGFDKPQDLQFKPNDWQRDPQQASPDTVWHHVSQTDLAPGTVLTPGGGHSQWGRRFHMGPNEARGKWTWMDTPDKADWWDESGSGHVYEVKPSAPPHPWNNTGADGWVAPSATVVRKIRGPRR